MACCSGGYGVCILNLVYLANVETHTCTYAYIHMYIHTYIHIHTHMYTHIHMHIHIHAHAHTHTHVHTHIHTCTHICTHTINLLGEGLSALLAFLSPSSHSLGDYIFNLLY